MDFNYLIQALVGLLSLILLYKFCKRTPLKGPSAPEPFGAWPLLGHLPLLGVQKKPPCRVFGAMADQYGPVFTIWMGTSRPTLVVSSKKAIKECLTTNDRTFASRPVFCVGKYFSYNFAGFASAPYGTCWREGRKLATVHLLSNHRMKLLNNLVYSEVNTFIHDLYQHSIKECTDPISNPNVIVLSEWLRSLSLKLFLRLIVGKRYSSGDHAGEIEKLKHTIEDMVKVSLVPSDIFPSKFLERLDLGGYIASVKQTAKKMDLIIESWIDEHSHQNKLGKDACSEEDLIDVLLSTAKEGFDPNHSRLTIIKATILTLVGAAYDTTSDTLIWAVSLLLNNTHVLRHAQDELDFKVGRERLVSEDDIEKLVYLQAIVKETMRLYPAAPLSLPHASTQDCNVAGYHIRKGTMLMLNLWKLHRDPDVWTDPEEFKPERFINHLVPGGVDTFEQNFELIPFGAGRRSCPGKTMALRNLHLSLARLLQAFELRTPKDVPVDMSESIAITLPKATPLEVVLTPRLREKLYYQL